MNKLILRRGLEVNLPQLQDGELVFLKDKKRLVVGPDKTEIPNMEDLQSLYDLIYPVGVLLAFNNDEDYSNFLGLKWERALQGKVPVGQDLEDTDFSTIGSQLGEKQHVLTPDESCPISYEPKPVGADTPGESIADPEYLGNASQGHNNIQPSQVVAWWVRVQ